MKKLSFVGMLAIGLFLVAGNVSAQTDTNSCGAKVSTTTEGKRVTTVNQSKKVDAHTTVTREKSDGTTYTQEYSTKSKDTNETGYTTRPDTDKVKSTKTVCSKKEDEDI